MRKILATAVSMPILFNLLSSPAFAIRGDFATMKRDFSARVIQRNFKDYQVRKAYQEAKLNRAHATSSREVSHDSSVPAPNFFEATPHPLFESQILPFLEAADLREVRGTSRFMKEAVAEHKKLEAELRWGREGQRLIEEVNRGAYNRGAYEVRIKALRTLGEFGAADQEIKDRIVAILVEKTVESARGLFVGQDKSAEVALTALQKFSPLSIEAQNNLVRTRSERNFARDTALLNLLVKTLGRVHASVPEAHRLAEDILDSAYRFYDRPLTGRDDIYRDALEAIRGMSNVSPQIYRKILERAHSRLEGHNAAFGAADWVLSSLGKRAAEPDAQRLLIDYIQKVTPQGRSEELSRETLFKIAHAISALENVSPTTPEIRHALATASQDSRYSVVPVHHDQLYTTTAQLLVPAREDQVHFASTEVNVSHLAKEALERVNQREGVARSEEFDSPHWALVNRW